MLQRWEGETKKDVDLSTELIKKIGDRRENSKVDILSVSSSPIKELVGCVWFGYLTVELRLLEEKQE